MAESSVHINAELTALIDGALDRGRPVMVAYVDAEGQPHLSFRGSTQGHSDDQLAMWIREPNGGLPQAIPSNPRVTLMYRDTDQRTTYLFYGRARVVSDSSVADAIYEKTPKKERERDPGKAGVAVVIDVDSIQASLPSGRVDMRRT